ncbi:hypothetical protein H5410_042795 [Solanum commersonii]|uniref:Pectin acetylesterase n=1 Tax=Solanum commersonii TaxID=4109 RepID=A0A9J5XVQ8_SOLCO|nr:hypothetical protein H5410_042795 [Solanum commersonii]
MEFFISQMKIVIGLVIRMTTFVLTLLAFLPVFCTTHVLSNKHDSLYVNITILQSATAQGAVCLDGSPPAYHLDRGYGTGLRSWIIYLDGGSWCESIPDCLDRSTTSLGSSNHMKQRGFFAGILHNTSKQNPEFHNWNRVRVKYCDGSSFTGDVEQVHSENKLYFRGARIFKAIMEDLWRKGMKSAENAILSGTSAGGLATILNCDKFKCLLPESAKVKCVADAAFFINSKTIYGTSYIQEMYRKIVNLHGSTKNLPSACTSVMEPSLINNTLVPLFLDPQHAWTDCINNISRCTSSQLIIIQAFGVKFLKTFNKLPSCCTRGYFLTSCYSHGDLRFPTYWFSASSPRLLNKTIAEAVADWYFERAGEIKNRRMGTNFLFFFVYLLNFVTTESSLVNLTILQTAVAKGAVCLDGSPPAYHLDRGSGTGVNNWVISVEGGGWCQNVAQCLLRKNSKYGSSAKMENQIFFSGMLKFYNWNRVFVRYCDGGSFTGDVEAIDPGTGLHYRGARIFKAIMKELLAQGMNKSENAILSGCSAGGMTTILHCDNFRILLPNSVKVKCFSDAGYFIDNEDISGELFIQQFYNDVVTLHGSVKNLPPSCTSKLKPGLCFFPQNVAQQIQTPLFIINSAYDGWQVRNILVPRGTDPKGFRLNFLKALEGLGPSSTRGYYINSCFAHCQTQKQASWFGPNSPRLFNKTIAEAVGDWVLEINQFRQIDCPYPCDKTCG